MFKKIGLLAMAVMCSFVGASNAQSMSNNFNYETIDKKTIVIEQILKNVSPDIIKKPKGDEIKLEIISVLHKRSYQQITDLQKYTNFNDLLTALKSKNFAGESEALYSKQTSYGADDLIFIPISPCRLANTSEIQQKLSANEVRTFALSDFSKLQGGDKNCNASSNIPNFEQKQKGAVVINITATNAEAPGHLRASPSGVATASSVLNYMPGVDIANTTIVKNSGYAFTGVDIYTSAKTDVIIDLLGFYAPAAAPEIQCESVSAFEKIFPNGFAQISAPACPAGKTSVSVSCFSNNSTLNGQWSPVNLANGGQPYCNFRNNSDSTDDLFIHRTCCSISNQRLVN